MTLTSSSATPGTQHAYQPASGSEVVEMRGIWKEFPGVVANRGVDLDLRTGEVHALLGENGAGKTTLMNILSGLYLPDAGTVRIQGREVSFRSPAQAIHSGIGMVHQHFRLVEVLTAAENIHLGWEDTPQMVSPSALAQRTAKISAEFGLSVEPLAKIWQLSTGEQQRVEILRVLARGARVLILDEPTSVLTPNEVSELFRVLRKLAASGRTVVFISHKLDEVLAVSDRVTVLRRGRVVASRLTAESDQRTLARLAIGQEVISQLERKGRPPGRAVLEVRGAWALNDRGRVALSDFNLTIREGEVVGVAGIAGNGQSELAQVLTGLRRLQKGTVAVDGVELGGVSPTLFADAGVGHIPEDRMGVGLVPSGSVTENAILREYRQPPISARWRIDSRAATRFAEALIERAAVKVPNVQVRVRNLSGGNQQRLLAGRETRIASRLLVAVHPTQGLDVRATEEVRRVLLEHRNAGSAVLLVSEDLDEIMMMSDRIVVTYAGRIIGEFDAATAQRETIGLLMGGASAPGLVSG